MKSTWDNKDKIIRIVKNRTFYYCIGDHDIILQYIKALLFDPSHLHN